MHVTSVHQKLTAPTQTMNTVSSDVMRSYIAYAQTFSPTIPAELHNYIVARYVEKRKFQREGKEELSYTYITPRTLLAIIRISQAMAKFHFRNSVAQKDVDQAIQLIDFSFKTLEEMKSDGNNKRKFSKFYFFYI